MSWQKFFAPVLLLAGVTLAAGQNGGAQIERPDRSQFTGVWRAQMDGLPAVAMVVTDEGGSLMGAVQFYFHMRKTVNDQYTSTPGLPEPIFALHVEGNTLTFDVSHRRAHPPRTMHDPPVHFRLRLISPNRAELMNESEQGPAPAVTMERSEY
jgi:hypothetical protein